MVFYASNDTYAVAVLVFVKLLRQYQTVACYDIVLVHHPLSSGLLRQIEGAGIVARAATTPLQLPHAYYRDCLLKLRIFELLEYELIVYVDADAIPLRSLDVLFSMETRSALAAPVAYWLPHHYWTSSLMRVQPSREMVDRIQVFLATNRMEGLFDMDIINRLFANEMETLPSEYFCLDSEWEVAKRPGYFDGWQGIVDSLLVVHFSTLTKPWSLSPEKVRRRRPEASRFYYDLRETWWDAMQDVLSRSPRAFRTRFRILQRLAQFRS